MLVAVPVAVSALVGLLVAVLPRVTVLVAELVAVWVGVKVFVAVLPKVAVLVADWVTVLVALAVLVARLTGVMVEVEVSRGVKVLVGFSMMGEVERLFEQPPSNAATNKTKTAPS